MIELDCMKMIDAHQHQWERDNNKNFQQKSKCTAGSRVHLTKVSFVTLWEDVETFKK